MQLANATVTSQVISATGFQPVKNETQSNISFVIAYKQPHPMGLSCVYTVYPSTIHYLSPPD